MRHVAALGITQILGYGAIFYAFPIFVPHVSAEFGVAQSNLYAVFSAGLLLGGIVASFAGPMLDRFGSAQMMSIGSLLAALLLGGLGLAPNYIVFSAFVILLEALSFLVLYDAAFAALAVGVPKGTRRAITRLTLIAGFASTIFWPLTAMLIEALGWRGTYLCYAALHLIIALPLHRWLAHLIRQQAVSRAPEASVLPIPEWPLLTGDTAQRASRALGIAFSLIAIVIAAFGVHLVPVLLAQGLDERAYLVSMAMGPAQVLIRVIDATLWRHYHPLSVAIFSVAALLMAIIALAFAGGNLALALSFAILFGAAQGLTSIVRGAVPLALFGPDRIGRRLGQLAALRNVSAAAAPFAFALGLAQLGLGATLLACFLLASAGLMLLFWLRHLVQRSAAS